MLKLLAPKNIPVLDFHTYDNPSLMGRELCKKEKKIREREMIPKTGGEGENHKAGGALYNLNGRVWDELGIDKITVVGFDAFPL